MVDIKEIETNSKKQFNKECKKVERAGYILDEYYSNKKYLQPDMFEKIKAVKCYNLFQHGIITKEIYIYLFY